MYSLSWEIPEITELAITDRPYWVGGDPLARCCACKSNVDGLTAPLESPQENYAHRLASQQHHHRLPQTGWEQDLHSEQSHR